jgi:hypothetical protein
MIDPVEGSGTTPACISFVESFMPQRYFIQFNKSLTGREQHDESRFAPIFTGFKIGFTPFGRKHLPTADCYDMSLLPAL